MPRVPTPQFHKIISLLCADVKTKGPLKAPEKTPAPLGRLRSAPLPHYRYKVDPAVGIEHTTCRKACLPVISTGGVFDAT